MIPRGHPRKRTRQFTETLEDKYPSRCSSSEFHEFGNLFRRPRPGACGSLPLAIMFCHAPSSTHRTHVSRGPRPSACLSQSLLSPKKKDRRGRLGKISHQTETVFQGGPVKVLTRYFTQYNCCTKTLKMRGVSHQTHMLRLRCERRSQPDS